MMKMKIRMLPCGVGIKFPLIKLKHIENKCKPTKKDKEEYSKLHQIVFGCRESLPNK